LISRNTTRELKDDLLIPTFKILIKFMEKISKEINSRYYTFMGFLEYSNGFIYNPYVSPTSRILIKIKGDILRASLPEIGYKKKVRTKINIEEALLRLDDVARLSDR